jgi:hypothetical protein
VFAVQTHLTTDDTEQFQLALSGSGTLDSPWLLQVTYSGGAGLNGLPDVDADLPDDGYVLGYDASTQTWVPQAPTTVAAGTNTVGNGIDGDGSSGDALVAVGNAARYISVTGSGIGLSDAGINRLVRVFDTIAARDAASPVPVEGTLAFVADTPDALYYYDGAAATSTTSSSPPPVPTRVGRSSPTSARSAPPPTGRARSWPYPRLT